MQNTREAAFKTPTKRVEQIIASDPELTTRMQEQLQGRKMDQKLSKLYLHEINMKEHILP